MVPPRPARKNDQTRLSSIKLEPLPKSGLMYSDVVTERSAVLLAGPFYVKRGNSEKLP